MKVCCVFPAHRRAAITLETIRLLKRQTVKPHVIMVGDSRVEAAIANEAGCEYIQYANRPLSSKWQVGVWRAGDYNPEAVLVMGSDHWFTPDWCETYLSHLKKHDVVGCSGWRVLRLEKRSIQIVHRSYRGPRSAEPIGMGRMYSRAAMRQMGWTLYKERKNRRVDGVAMRRAQSLGLKVAAIDPPGTMALTVKCSQWSMLHSWDDMHGNKNLVEHPDVKSPGAWLRDYFPGSLEAIKRLRKQVF
jgi:hypothetical protein